MNSLTKIGFGVFALVVVFSMISQCGERENTAPPKATEVILREYSKGLDLDAVTNLAKSAKDAADFEKRLNSSSEGVNNIDLNDDGTVDYIKVTEYGSGDRKGFSLSTEISPGETQEIATIEFRKEADRATVQTTGNPSLYGANHYHHSSFGMTDALLLAWMFSDRPNYTSPYGYGNRPPYYGGGWSTRPYGSYQDSMNGRNAGSTVTRSSAPVISQPIVSPNAEKTAAKARALSNPTVSQRSFSSPSSSTSSPSSSSATSSSGSTSKGFPGSSVSRPSSSSFGGFGRSGSSSSFRSGGSRGGK